MAVVHADAEAGADAVGRSTGVIVAAAGCGGVVAGGVGAVGAPGVVVAVVVVVARWLVAENRSCFAAAAGLAVLVAAVGSARGPRGHLSLLTFLLSLLFGCCCYYYYGSGKLLENGLNLCVLISVGSILLNECRILFKFENILTIWNLLKFGAIGSAPHQRVTDYSRSVFLTSTRNVRHKHRVRQTNLHAHTQTDKHNEMPKVLSFALPGSLSQCVLVSLSFLFLLFLFLFNRTQQQS